MRNLVEFYGCGFLLLNDQFSYALDLPTGSFSYEIFTIYMRAFEGLRFNECIVGGKKLIDQGAKKLTHRTV